jgi:hypothetical protein
MEVEAEAVAEMEEEFQQVLFVFRIIRLRQVKVCNIRFRAM